MLNDCNIEIGACNNTTSLSTAFHTAMVFMSFGGRVNFVFYLLSNDENKENAALKKYNEALNDLLSLGEHTLFLIESNPNTEHKSAPKHAIKLTYAQWSQHECFLNNTFNF